MTTTTTTTNEQHPECLICGIWIGDVEGDDLESNRCADHPAWTEEDEEAAR